MVKTKKKKSIVRRFFFNSKAFFLLGLVLLVLISFPLFKKVNQKYRIDSEIKELEEEIIALENKNSNLKDFVSYLESDQFIEEQARLQFGLKKEGEEAVVIQIEEPEANINEDIIVKNNIKASNNIEKWFNYFFNVILPYGKSPTTNRAP